MIRGKLILVLTCFALLGGCSTTLKTTSVNTDTGEFETSHKISHGGVKIAEPFEEGYANMVYVKTDEKAQEYNDFFINSVKNSNKFNKVMSKQDMESLVLREKLTDNVSSVSDLIGLHNLQKHIGNFLILEPYVEWKGGYNYTSSLKAIDAETGETVLYLVNDAFNWDGLDQPLFYPLFNGLIQWADGRPINEEREIKN
ncbi:hypothetical protein [Enterovibrio coralii]|uniref:Lipoprotein n=1 Tax=Enterovibrio coralii TaxID=294935 RepID=A0A135I5M3_9GAMM|nr:hypothetical protein [Enterovibrio coralii]KXF80749.1 hypothetical protein ATN88_15800 [Enterovibrio coralii]